MTIDKETRCAVGLSFFEGIGPQRFKLLKNYFGSAGKIYQASKKELLATGLYSGLVEKFCFFRQNFDLDTYINNFQKKGINVITWDNKDYPQLLKQIPNPPFVLYLFGDKTCLADSLKLAIVGTRKPTNYGVEVTRKITGELVSEGFTIVSGMAMGIDAVAHQTTLEGKGRTIAVLGCGVDICYPAINKSIYEEIIKHGLVVSEFPPGKRTSRGVFPSRNRIVVGLSLGVLVIEGSDKSGTLITTNYAADFGRDVFACPGPITSEMSKATTYLLKHGAKVVGGAEDIFEEYKIEKRKAKEKQTINKLTNLTDLEKKIVDLTKNYSEIHIDTLIQKIENESSAVFTAVSLLEIKGILRKVENDKYILNTT